MSNPVGGSNLLLPCGVFPAPLPTPDPAAVGSKGTCLTVVSSSSWAHGRSAGMMSLEQPGQYEIVSPGGKVQRLWHIWDS